MHTIFMIALLLQAVFSVSVEICGEEYDTETTTRLDLSNKNLTELPPQIGQLKNLQQLWLYGNYLAELPNEIGQLVNLQQLNLNGNNLTTLPSQIGKLVKLQELGLSNNNLTTLPQEIGKLKKLQILGLSNNELTKLPEEIVQLVELQGLNLNDNKLATLPQEIVQLVDLQILYLNGNNLKKLPQEIVQLENLQELDLSDNKITTLPQEIVHLVNLQKLYLNVNDLKELPKEIAQLVELQILDLNGNELKELPQEIAQLVNLQELGLSSNKLIALPQEIVQLVNLQKLYLNGNNLKEIPKEIGQLVNMQLLSLSDNKLTSLPSQIGQLVNLQILYLNNNELTTLPQEIVQLVKLQELGLNDNNLTALPQEIGKLKKLQILGLSNNELTKLPEEIVQLVELQGLNLNGNELTTLPQKIGQLANLQQLWLYANNLTELPKEIGQLVNLQKLYLNGNNLKEIPKEIGQLVKLQRLYLSNNKLTTLPKEIAQLVELQILDLYGNKLTTLPVEIGNLHNLTLLDLRCNNAVESSDDAMTMGKTELRQRFGDHVLLNDNTVRFEQVEIPKKRVYRNLMNESIHWNFDELKKLKPSSIPASNHTEQSLMEVWSSVYMKKWRESDPKGVEDIIYANERILTAIYGSSVGGLFDRNVSEKDKNIARILELLVKNRDEDTMEENITKLGSEDKTVFRDMWDENKDRIIANNNKWTIDDFIHHIYNPGEEYRRWAIADRDNHPSIVLARNLIGNILDKLCEVGDDDAVVSNINSMCEGLEYCPDRQIAEMRLVYQILTGEAKADSLDDFVRSVIGEEKERVFGYVVTPDTGQSVHVLNVLTNKMADEIGLNRTIETVLGTMGQDRFNGWPGNILRAFYSSFTPEHMFRVVKEHINGRGSMTTKALQLIYDSDISNENKLKMCRYREEGMIDASNDDQVEDTIGMSDGITEDFVRWYLTEMGIVQPSRSATGEQ